MLFLQGLIPVAYYVALFLGPIVGFVLFMYKRGCRSAWNTGFCDGYKKETVSSREIFHKVFRKAYDRGVIAGANQKIANQKIEYELWGTPTTT